MAVGVSTEVDAGPGSSYLRARLLWKVRARAMVGFTGAGNQGVFGVVQGRRARRASVHWKRQNPYSSSTQGADRGDWRPIPWWLVFLTKAARGSGAEGRNALAHWIWGVTRNGQADLTGRLDDAEIAGQTPDCSIVLQSCCW